MILADTSAWVEWLRATGSRVHLRMRELVEAGDAVASTDPVLLELLAGARDDETRRKLRRMLASFDFLPVRGPFDYEDAADLYRACRRSGSTPRSLMDCLIAAVAIRNGVPVLHADSDFELLAETTPLLVA